MSRSVYASINIYSQEVSPVEVSSILSIDPDRSVCKGEEIRQGTIAKQNAWIYTSKDRVESDNLENHIEFLLDAIDGKSLSLNTVLESDSWMRILCFWESPEGNGGPVLSSKLIRKLSKFPFDIEFDVWT